MAKKEKSTDTINSNMTVNDLLAEEIVQAINKEFKNSAFILGGGNTPTDVTEFVSTGSTLLDLIISNRPNGGFPVGRIIELTGLEASGKSLMAAHALAATQRKGGIAVLIDNETSYDRNFLTSIGVNIDEMIYLHLEAIEDIFEAIEKIIAKMREKYPEKILTIVVDSVAAASTKKELEGVFDKEGYGTEKAMLISKGLRKLGQNFSNVCMIFTNQMRMKIGFVGFGDQYISPGGLALPHYASVRIRLKKVGKIAVKNDIVAVKVSANIVKNRIGPPLRTCEFNIYFDRGIDDLEGWFDKLCSLDVIDKPKSSQLAKLKLDKAYPEYQQLMEYINSLNGRIKEKTEDYIEFKNAAWRELIGKDNPLRQYCYSKLCDALILKYNQDDEKTEISEPDDNEIA